MAPSPPPAGGSGVEDVHRKLLLDDLVADRSDPEPLAAPVLGIDPVALDTLPQVRGRFRPEDVEDAARRNFRSAEEARRAVQGEHARLQAEALIRRKMEREVASLRRDLERMRESEKLRVAQARYSAEREARDEVLGEVEHVREEHERALLEIDRLRSALDSDRALMTEFSDRLREEQAAKAKAQADADHAMDARRQAEQRLELATETARRRGDDELRQLAAAESALREALTERDKLATEIIRLSADAGRGRDLSQTVADLEHLIGELEAALTAERARTDTATAHASQLTEEIDGLRQRGEEQLRSLAQVEQLEAELEGAVVAHGAAIDRVRAIDEEMRALEREFDATSRERDQLMQEVTELRMAPPVAPPASSIISEAELAKLERDFDATSNERDALMQEVADLRQELADRPAVSAAPPADTELVEVAQVEAELRAVELLLDDARAARDAFAAQVRELEASLAQSSARREEARTRSDELERTLAEAADYVQELEAELSRRGAPVDVAPAQIPAADVPATGVPPAEEPVSDGDEAVAPAPAPPAPVVRRSAFQELTAIATVDEDTPYRRRRR